MLGVGGVGVVAGLCSCRSQGFPIDVGHGGTLFQVKGLNLE
jgi:hypothetical protein